MKKNILMISLLVTTLTIHAQEKPYHQLGFSVNGGVSHLLLDRSLNPFNNLARPRVGGEAGAAFHYELQNKHFLFQTGLGVDWNINTNDLHPFQLSADILEYPTMHYGYNFQHYYDRSTYTSLYIPLMVGGAFKRFYFLAGTKLHLYSFAGSTTPSADVQMFGRDDDFVDIVENAPTHMMTDYHFAGTKQNAQFGTFDITASVELGFNLGKLIPQSVEKGKKQSRSQRYRMRKQKVPLKERTHYQLALYMDYGLLNRHPKMTNPISVSPETANAEGGLVKFDNLNQLTPYSMYGSHTTHAAILHNMQVGVKFTVLMELPRKPAKKDTPQLPSIVTLVSDSVGRPMGNVQVQTFSVDNPKRKPIVKTTESKHGRVEKGYPAGEYKIVVSRQGFNPDTIYFTHYDDFDTLRITLRAQQPPVVVQTSPQDTIKAISSFTLQNMYFATAKTEILPSSADGLNELYRYLKDNPDVRIRIVGHTDDVGSDESNQKLSEGRARSVRMAMISRGIEPDRILTAGRGEKEPVVPNDSDEHRQMNRRVEIQVLNE